MSQYTSSNSVEPVIVIAKYKFEGRNNDELSFAKNDIITVTQHLDGGWWEGSLDGRVGWFPADFVSITVNSKSKEGKLCGTPAAKNELEIDSSKLESSKAAFRVQLLREFSILERENLAIIEKSLDLLRFLDVEISNSCNGELMSNTILELNKFIEIKNLFLRRFGEVTRKELYNQKIGELFIDVAPEIGNILRSYCERYCDLMEQFNALSSQIQKQLLSAKRGDFKALIFGLSLVFRHVKKYGSTLQEIERNTPEGHFDRGNLQRSAQVYLDLHDECEMIRKQREAQLDFLQLKLLSEKFGNNCEKKLGKLLYVGKVGVSRGGETSSQEIDDTAQVVDVSNRTIAVFASAVLLLDVQHLSGHFSLSNLIEPIDLQILNFSEAKNAVYLREKGNDILTVRVIAKRDFGLLLNSLRSCCSPITADSDLLIEQGAKTPNRMRQRQVVNSENKIDENDQQQWMVGNSLANNSKLSDEVIHLDHQIKMVLPAGETSSQRQISDISAPEVSNGISTSSAGGQFSGLAFRPLPPQRAEWLAGSNTAGQQQIKLRKGFTTEEQEDALLLKIVEGYCMNNCSSAGPSNDVHCCMARQRQRNSADSTHSPCGGGPIRRAASYPDHHEMALKRPQLILAEDEKLFVEEMDGDQLVVKERSLVDTVYSLKDQLAALAKEVSGVAKILEVEQRSRRRLEELVETIVAGQHAKNQNGHL